MYFTGDDGYQNFLVFVPILSSLTVIAIKKLLTRYWLEYYLKKMKPFDTNLEPIMSNLATSRVILKFSNSVLVQLNLSSLYSDFPLNLYIAYELNN